MKRPRFSLGGLMIAIGAVGAEIALLRSVFDDQWPGRLGQALVIASPMIPALGYGLYSLVARIRSPFWCGFMPIGLLTTVAVFLDVWFDFGAIDAFDKYVVDPIDKSAPLLLGTSLWPSAGPREQEVASWCIAIPTLLALYSAPAALPAIFGGWFFTRYRMTITIQRRQQPQPATIPMSSFDSRLCTIPE